MKFKIKKEVNEYGIGYFTIPKNIFIRLWYYWDSSFSLGIGDAPYECFGTKEEAIQHIKRWNSGYYKKKYYSKWV